MLLPAWFRLEDIDIKLLFTQKPSLNVRIVALILASVVLMTVDHRLQVLQTFRASVAVLLYPLQFLTHLPTTSSEWVGETFATRQKLQEENARLRTQQLLIKARLQKLDSLMAENMRLRELLDSSFNIGERVLIAEVLAVDMEPFSRQIVINKGSRHGVFPGQPILDAEGIMGQVVHVTPITSTVIIITDPSHAVPIVVNRNGLRAIAVGSGTANLLDVPHIPNNADIQVGDLLVTSGLAGRFPAGYPVAKVIAIQHDPSISFAKITAQPTALLDRSREVLLVWQTQAKTEIATPCLTGEPNCSPAPATTPITPDNTP